MRPRCFFSADSRINSEPAQGYGANFSDDSTDLGAPHALPATEDDTNDLEAEYTTYENVAQFVRKDNCDRSQNDQPDEERHVCPTRLGGTNLRVLGELLRCSQTPYPYMPIRLAQLVTGPGTPVS